MAEIYVNATVVGLNITCLPESPLIAGSMGIYIFRIKDSDLDAIWASDEFTDSIKGAIFTNSYSESDRAVLYLEDGYYKCNIPNTIIRRLIRLYITLTALVGEDTETHKLVTRKMDSPLTIYPSGLDSYDRELNEQENLSLKRALDKLYNFLAEVLGLEWDELPSVTIADIEGSNPGYVIGFSIPRGKPAIIQSTTIEYAGSTTPILPTSGWQPTPEGLETEEYIWVRTTVIFEDEDIPLITYGLGKRGVTGDVNIPVNSLPWDRLHDQLPVEKIADGSIITSKIADGSITLDKMTDDSVDTNLIIDAAITTGKIADNAITLDKIANNVITTDKIPDDAITLDKIADNAVMTNNIVDNAITTNKIVNNAITTAKIADGLITNAKIANSTITSDKIVDGTIDANALGSNAVITSKIAGAAVTRAKLANDALYSPVIMLSGNFNLDSSYLGKTLIGSYSSSSATTTITITQATSITLPVGFEVAVCRPFNYSEVNISFSGLRLIYDGTFISTAADKTASLPELGTMIALKKIETDNTNGDLWLITGNVEVV